MALYDLYGLQYWNLSTVPGVTLTNSCGHIYEWGQTFIQYTYLLVGMNPMIRYLNFLNGFPWSGLVIKYHVIPFLGHHSPVNSFLFIQYVTKNNLMLMCAWFSWYLSPYRYSQELCQFSCLGRQFSWWHCSLYILGITSGTNNPGGTQKPDNSLKGTRNPIPRNMDNPRKGIRELVPNGIRSQWTRGLTVPT